VGNLIERLPNPIPTRLTVPKTGSELIISNLSCPYMKWVCSAYDLLYKYLSQCKVSTVLA